MLRNGFEVVDGDVWIPLEDTDVPWDVKPQVPVGQIPFAPTTMHRLPCGHVFITYRANDSLTLRLHKQTCRGGRK